MNKKIADIISLLSDLTLLEASELVKKIEETFGVTASSPIVSVSTVATNTPVAEVAEEKTAIETMKTDLIKKHGTEDEDKNISIPMWIDEEKDEDGNIISAKPNPTFIKFQEEFNALLQEEKELEYHEFKLDDFKTVETSDNYAVFYKLIQVD